MAKTTTAVTAPATGAAVALRAAVVEAAKAQVRQRREKALAEAERLRPEVERIAAAHRAAAEAEAAIDGLSQSQVVSLAEGEERLRRLAQSLSDRRAAHEVASATEGAELKELRNALEQARRLGLTASNDAVKVASARVSELEAAKAARIQGIREVLNKAHGVIRGLRALPIPNGGWKPAEGPVAELVAAVRAAAKEAGRAKEKPRKGFSTGPKPKGVMEAAFERASS